ncbi:hypothetical protein BT93_K0767 [Corymbia citriodora subsp. variegata]|nr:hypothetical protein BT93_K0767 [Corymbia citriodora subsp. variegata]KAF8006561.1 hypothetical protein BT93_K0767 [Corymbia citriodora subsp. variegata]
MHFTAGWQSIAAMGYAMSRLEIEPESWEEEKSLDGVGNSQGPNGLPRCLDHEIAHLTNLKSRPHEHLIRDFPGRRALPVSPVKMLAGRECNYSGRGRFSSADCCHMLSRYVPVNGPLLIYRMNSRAYVSQFSADGSLFVAGFQGSHIRIYNVEKGWKCQKNILAKSLRWTITDTSLSPDQRYLVSSCISCKELNLYFLNFLYFQVIEHLAELSFKKLGMAYGCCSICCSLYVQRTS